MDFGLKGKHALVMGSSSGIGYGIAKVLTEEGATTALCGRDRARLDQAVASLSNAEGIPCDLSKTGAAVALVEEAVSRFGKLDILVTNTGGPPKGDFLDLTTEKWEIGFQGLFLSARIIR